MDNQQNSEKIYKVYAVIGGIIALFLIGLGIYYLCIKSFALAVVALFIGIGMGYISIKELVLRDWEETMGR